MIIMNWIKNNDNLKNKIKLDEEFANIFIDELLRKKSVGTINEITHFHHLFLFLETAGYKYDVLNFKYYLNKNILILQNINNLKITTLGMYIKHDFTAFIEKYLKKILDKDKFIKINDISCVDINFECNDLIKIIQKKLVDLQKYKYNKIKYFEMKENFKKWSKFDYSIFIEDNIEEIKEIICKINDIHIDSELRKKYIEELYFLNKKDTYYKNIQKELNILPKKIPVYGMIISNIELFILLCKINDKITPSAPTEIIMTDVRTDIPETVEIIPIATAIYKN